MPSSGRSRIGARLAAWSVLRSGWARVLVGLLGACELLMAAGASPAPMLVGGIGGSALVVAAGLGHRHRPFTVALLVIGSVPIAVLAWTALVLVLVLVLVAALAMPLLRGPTPFAAR